MVVPPPGCTGGWTGFWTGGRLALGCPPVAGFGLVALYSAIHAGVDSTNANLFTKQIVWYSAGTVVMVVAFLFDFKT